MLSAVSVASSKQSEHMFPRRVDTTTAIIRPQESHDSRLVAESRALSCSAIHMRSVSGSSTCPLKSSENRMCLMLRMVGRIMFHSSNSSSRQDFFVFASFFSSKRLGWALGLDCGGFMDWSRAISARISSSDMSLIFAIGSSKELLPDPGLKEGHVGGNVQPGPGNARQD